MLLKNYVVKIALKLFSLGARILYKKIKSRQIPDTTTYTWPFEMRIKISAINICYTLHAWITWLLIVAIIATVECKPV